jgi:hypothetical protein
VNYEDFFQEIREKGLELKFDNPGYTPGARLSNEALFHLPLLAITILMLAKGSRKPKIDQIGQLVGECFERTFTGFKGSSQHLGWSATLRVRTVKALTFLETAGLVYIENGRIAVTLKGKSVIAAGLEAESTDLAYTLRVVERNYRNISVEKQISLGLE